MKNLILKCFIIVLVFASCSTDNANSPEQDIQVNLETFVPDAKFDLASEGKYVGIFGHHTNRDMHGVIYINVGQQNQYNALVRLVDGAALKFSVKRSLDVDVDVSNLFFEGESGSFLADFIDFTNPVISNVMIKEETTEGYIVVKKARGGTVPFVRIGTYNEWGGSGFNGNWDLIGDGVEVSLPSVFGTVNSGQQVSQLVISHSGVTTPFVDNTFEPHTNKCLDTSNDIDYVSIFPVTNPMLIQFEWPDPEYLSVIADQQTSTFNGKPCSWSLIYLREPYVNSTGVYLDNSCQITTIGGLWSWNGLFGYITVGSVPTL